jgi:hypothetical protein
MEKCLMKLKDGSTKEVMSLDFEVEYEPFSRYRLENGKILKIKTTLFQVLDSGEVGEDGEPMYNVITRSGATTMIPVKPSKKQVQ